jgi:hypothetical protein
VKTSLGFLYLLRPAMKTLGFGLGLRPDHYDAILSERPSVGFKFLSELSARSDCLLLLDVNAERHRVITPPPPRSLHRMFVQGVVSCASLLLVSVCAPARSVATTPTDREDSQEFSNVVSVGQSTITVRWRGPAADVGQEGLYQWIDRSAAIVRGYYGQFPVKFVAVEVSTVDSDKMGSGRTFGYPRPRIEVTVGRHTSAQALKDDWVLVHEMIHLAFPEVADAHTWLAEGIATYVEGVARTQAGNLSDTALWADYVKAIPQGLPQENDRGLDRTHSWARTYWGGALYCLIADVRIREQTNNRRGLQDALQAIAKLGAGMSSEWPVERIFATGDSATGTHVMTEIYDAMKDKPASPDLKALWADLGIQMIDGAIRLDDSSRLAAIRRAITHAADAG